MTSFSFWQRWLLVMGVIIAVFGILMALFSGTPLFDIFNQRIDPVFWGGNPVDERAKEFQHWLYGVGGSTIAGWGIFVAFIAHYPFRKQERWAWHCLVTGLLVWFAFDTALSLIYRVYFNVVFNMALLLLVMMPVIFTRKHS